MKGRELETAFSKTKKKDDERMLVSQKKGKFCGGVTYSYLMTKRGLRGKGNRCSLWNQNGLTGRGSGGGSFGEKKVGEGQR